MLTTKNVFDIYDLIKDLRLEIKSDLTTSHTEICNKIDCICDKINTIQQDNIFRTTKLENRIVVIEKFRSVLIGIIIFCSILGQDIYSMLKFII